jgi:hypothetical protein
MVKKVIMTYAGWIQGYWHQYNNNNNNNNNNDTDFQKMPIL